MDYIFSFLRYDSKSLLACSEAHPSFASMVERDLYYHIILSASSSKSQSAGHGYRLKPSHLNKILFDTPRIANHVRVLQISARGEDFDDSSDEDSEPFDEEDADSIVFPALETFLFTSEHFFSWQEIPQDYMTGVEEILRLPTLHSVHIDGWEFPLSILDNNPNIDCLSLSGSPEIPDGPDDANAYPQLKSLIIKNHRYAAFWNWAKRRTFKLQSLQCDYSNGNMFLNALEICSGTLKDLDLKISSPYTTKCYLDTGESYNDPPPIPLINLSSLPHLQHLTVRVDVNREDDSDDTDFDDDIQELCASCLPSAVKILKTASSLQHLTIEICNKDYGLWSSIDFSSLAALAESTSFPHVDLYVMNATHKQVVSKLMHYDSLRNWIAQGVLVIHAKETAPGTPQFIY